MVNSTKETFENNGIEVITDKLGELWLNERHVPCSTTIRT